MATYWFLKLFTSEEKMNLDKSQKRIAKRVKRGFQGYPMISIRYFGPSEKLATKVEVGFIEQQNAQPMIEKFTCLDDIRQDETVQTTIIKIIDRVDAKTVTLQDSVNITPWCLIALIDVQLTIGAVCQKYQCHQSRIKAGIKYRHQGESNSLPFFTN